MSWRPAGSLVKFRDQINAAHPNRSKAADGTIGDEAHKLQGNASDHNPWLKDHKGVGVVTALDITHDPVHGVDIDKLSDQLAASRDPRIKYMIANGLILIPNKQSWAAEYGWHWQDYLGDPHTSHIHISVNPENCDDKSNWNIGKRGEEMAIIQDTDAWYQRFKKLMMHARGRKSNEFTLGEFRKNFVGNEAFRMVEVVLDHPEAERALKWLSLGRDAAPTEAQKKLEKIKEIVT